jgi:hypothetical protein
MPCCLINTALFSFFSQSVSFMPQRFILSQSYCFLTTFFLPCPLCQIPSMSRVIFPLPPFSSMHGLINFILFLSLWSILPGCNSFLVCLSFSLKFLPCGALIPPYHSFSRGALLPLIHSLHAVASSSSSFLPCGVSFFLVGIPSIWVSFFIVGIPSMWGVLFPSWHSFHMGVLFYSWHSFHVGCPIS